VAAVPRRLFLPEAPKHEVSQSAPAALEDGVTLPPIDVTLMMLRALDLTGTERVLEIGCGTGYQAALLCASCPRSHFARNQRHTREARGGHPRTPRLRERARHPRGRQQRLGAACPVPGNRRGRRS
jgi:hypothetical protein